MRTITVKTPPCIVCDAPSIVELQRAEWVALQGGALIQEALPTRDADFRELVKSGTHPACWAEMFGDEEDDNDAP